jgi:hypothetical protein
LEDERERAGKTGNFSSGDVGVVDFVENYIATGETGIGIEPRDADGMIMIPA